MPSHVYRNDSNQPAIIKGLKQAHVRILSTAKIGDGTPDVVALLSYDERVCVIGNQDAAREVEVAPITAQMEVEKSRLGTVYIHG